MKKPIIAGLAMMMGLTVQAEPIRTKLTKENRFPEPMQLEMTIGYLFEDFEDDSETTTLDGTLRLGIAEGFSGKVRIPAEEKKDGFTGDSETGLGDVEVGFELRLWEDIFRYPYVLLLGNLNLDTADEDKGLGLGERVYEVGLTVGTVTHEKFHWAAEGRYQFYDESENRAVGAASLLWEVGPAFALILEGQLREDPESIESDSPFLMLGGLYYEVNEHLNFSLHGGTENNSNNDAFAGGEVSYTF